MSLLVRAGALASVAALCAAQNGSLADLPSYQSAINATRNDRSRVVLDVETKDKSGRNDTAP